MNKVGRKFIYRGGYNPKDGNSVRSAYFYEYALTIKRILAEGKKVAFVTLAREDGYYDVRIKELFGELPTIIGRVSPPPAWNTYDLVVICGGDKKQLKTFLLEKKFSLSALHEDAVVLGDSAGAYMLSAYYYDDGKFEEGFYPESRLVVIAHANDPLHATPEKIEAVTTFASTHNLEMIFLKENESKILTEAHSLEYFRFDELF